MKPVLFLATHFVELNGHTSFDPFCFFWLVNAIVIQSSFPSLTRFRLNLGTQCTEFFGFTEFFTCFFLALTDTMVK